MFLILSFYLRQRSEFLHFFFPFLLNVSLFLKCWHDFAGFQLDEGETVDDVFARVQMDEGVTVQDVLAGAVQESDWWMKARPLIMCWWLAGVGLMVEGEMLTSESCRSQVTTLFRSYDYRKVRWAAMFLTSFKGLADDLVEKED